MSKYGRGIHTTRLVHSNTHEGETGTEANPKRERERERDRETERDRERERERETKLYQARIKIEALANVGRVICP